MAIWDVSNQKPSSSSCKLNTYSYKTIPASSDTAKEQVSGYTTSDAAEEAAKKAAKTKAEKDANALYTTPASRIERMWSGYLVYSNGTISTPSSTVKLGNEFETGASNTFGEPVVTASGGSGSSHSANAQCSWQRWIGVGRKTYVQCYKFKITPSIVKKGELNITLNDNSSATTTLYMAVSSSATFPIDYTSLPYQTFSGTGGGTKTITLATNIITALNSMSSTATSFYLIVGYASGSYQNRTYYNVGDVSLSVNYKYTSCTAPTMVNVSSNFVKPGSEFTVSWSGATAGVNVAISEYEVQYTIKKADGSVCKEATTVNSSTTSKTFIAEDEEHRGYLYTFNVKAVSSVSGYDSAYSTATATCRINRLPTLTISKSTSVVPSTGGTPTASFTMADDDGQNLTAYYQIGSSGTATKVGSSTTWTSPEQITEDTTVYLWANDGLEDGEKKSFTTSINERPSFNFEDTELFSSTGRFIIGSTSYTSSLKNEYKPDTYDYVPVIESISWAKIEEKKDAKERQCRLYYSDTLDGDISFSSDYISITTSSSELANYNVAAQIGSTDTGRAWRLRYRYSDGIEWSDWVYSKGYSIAPWPKITGIYNGYDGASEENSDAPEYFYKKLSIIHTEDTAFFGGSSVSGASYEIKNSGKGTTKKSETSSETANYFNLDYTDPVTPEYNTSITFSLVCKWGSTMQGISSEALIRCPNLLETNASISGLPIELKPYSVDSLSASIPFIIGGEKGNDSSTYSYKTGLNLLEAPLSAAVKIGEESVYLSNPSITNKSASGITTTWEITELKKETTNDTFKDATITFYCETVFGEKFEVSSSLTVNYKEGISFSSKKIEVQTKNNEGKIAYSEISKAVSGLYEGVKLKFSFACSGPNIQYVDICLYRKKSGGEWISCNESKTTINIEEKNSEVSSEVSYTIPEHIEDSTWEFQLSAVGQVTKITTEAPIGDTYGVERLTNASFSVTDASYDSTNKFTVKTRFKDCGGSGAQIPYIEGLSKDNSKLTLEYDTGENYVALETFNELPTDDSEIIEKFAVEFPNGKTYINARLKFETTIEYPSITINGTEIIPYNSDGKNSITKTSYSNVFSIYNIVPTIRYGYNRVGLNIFSFSTKETNLLEIAKYDERNTVAALGDVAEIYLDNFVISGGEWD